ncbi:MAG: molybdopterin dinucleotide binding domain-containing protein, partial [Halanaeroarchaeum sp.]
TDVEPARPLHMINWKSRNVGTTRTTNAPWLREVVPTNPLWMHPRDATLRGIETGDEVEIDAGRKTVTATAYVTRGIRAGVVGAMYGWGRAGDGAVPQTIDGDTRDAITDPYNDTPYKFTPPLDDESTYAQGRDAGFAVNHVAPLDDYTGDVGPSDQVGGSQTQYDTHVEVTKTGDDHPAPNDSTARDDPGGDEVGGGRPPAAGPNEGRSGSGDADEENGNPAEHGRGSTHRRGHSSTGDR